MARCQMWMYAFLLCTTLVQGSADEDLRAKLSGLTKEDLGCLRLAPQGCAALKDRFSCLSSSSEGGSAACVWCGGGLCQAGSPNLCEPLKVLQGAQALPLTLETPSCHGGVAGVFEKASPPSRPSEEQLSRLNPVTGGCVSLKDMSSCVTSKDASGNATWGYTPYKVHGEACVWCGGVSCTDANAALCMPFDLLMNGQGPHHTLFYAKHSYKVAEVKESAVVPPSSEVSCLSMQNEGCPSLDNVLDCLGSADGRSEKTIFGREVRGQPCVWCNDGLCNERGAKCEPFDLQMNGEGYAFVTSYSKEPRVAQCKDGVVKRHFNVTKPKLDLPPPDMGKLQCLTMKEGGCKSISEKLACLSSLDGSEQSDVGGLALRGQPCVWCGGGKCTDDSDALCAPYEYLAKGVGKVFSSLMAVSTTVAKCTEPEVVFTEADVGCLKSAVQGCNQIQDMKNCTTSKEGRPYEYIAGFKVKGEPCVWCGGGLCHDGASNRCEPYDYALHGVGHAFHTKYSSGVFYKASCDKENQPGPQALPADWEIHGMNMHVDCGKPFPVWSKVGQRCGFCKVLVPSIKEDYKTCNDYCAAQGGLQCASAALGAIASCGATEPKSCDYNFQVYQHGICECQGQQHFEDLNEDFDKALPSPSQADMECLNKAENGCRALTDRLGCLSSVDHGFQSTFHGLKVKGEPCVWCGGVPCTSRDPTVLCEARDYLVNGKGLAFVHRHVALETASVARCEAADAPNGRSFGNVGCLTRQEKGCNSIQDMETCLASLDGRPFAQIAGLKVEGQPCVWCGGVPCNSNNGNLCEPYEFALHGKGHAYDVNHAENTYYTAACEDGHPVKHPMPSALARVGVSSVVDCGTPSPIWTSVGKTCGQCRVQVAFDQQKKFQTCDSYCQDQGLTCEKAFTSYLHSCDVKSTVSCSAHFDASAVLCQCQPKQALQAVYGQCGGKHWKGYTLCEAGAVCNVVTEEFSQCVPANTAKAGVRAYALESPADSTLSAAAPSLEAELGASPPPLGGASCSSHPKCAALKLSGDCCPNADGVALDCCSSFDAKTVVLDPTEPAPEATLEAPPVATFSTGWMRKPSQEELKCMPSEPKGCGTIRHKLMCLSRVDGRMGYTPHGLNVGGEPCVWCGGGPCTSETDAVCEPYNWLMNGQGKAYETMNAPGSWLVARCQDNRNAVFNNLGCLKRSQIGCNHIQEKHECLRSADARPFGEVAGFKARDQPCVWCGGGVCHSNNGNLCEPYDFVMNGQGQAFDSNYGFNTYVVAECTQDGTVLPMSYPHADVERGLPTQVRCGSDSTWSGVGKICGDCDVTVPNIFASFGSCNAYCAAQGGLKCLSAQKAFTHSCDAQPPDEFELTCDSPFSSGEFARCQCSASEQAADVLVEQNRDLPALPYAQCGGKQWTGVKNCKTGSTCFIINEWYSQCLPGANSNPDQAAQAAKNAAEAQGQPIADQAVAAGQAATKAATAAGQNAQSQATRAYVAAAGTAAISGLARPQASGIGEEAAHAAAQKEAKTTQEANQIAAKAIHDGEAIVFGKDESSDAAEIAGTAAANSAKDVGKSGDEQCQRAYHAALALAKGSGKTPKQQAELAAAVAQKAALRAELTPLQQVQCVVTAAQASSAGDFSDATADAMKHAGAVAAAHAGLTGPEADGVVANSIKATEEAKAEGLNLPKELMEKCKTTAEASGLATAAEAVVADGKALGLSAADAAEAARKCVYDAAVSSGKSPAEAAAASEAAGHTVAAAVTRPASGPLPQAPLQRVGEDCWEACGKTSGLCAFCGLGNACCRRDEINPTRVCQNVKSFSTWHHECVAPVHQPEDTSAVAAAVHDARRYEAATEAADAAGAAAVAAGGGGAAAAAAAGAAAAASAKSHGMSPVDQVTVAYKAAENAAKEGGMPQYAADQKAQEVAEAAAESGGMSPTEAAAAAAAAAAVVKGLPLPGAPVPPLPPPKMPSPEPDLQPPMPKAATPVPKPTPPQPPVMANEVPLPVPVVEPPQPTVLPTKVALAGPTAEAEELILPTPIPASAQAGINAAEEKKAQGGDLHQQAVAAAGTTGDYEVADHVTQEDAKTMATKAATYVAHKDGLAIDQAKAEGSRATEEAIQQQGGEFVAPTILPKKVPEAVEAGISAADALPATAPLQDQVVAAASAAGSQAIGTSSETTAEKMATEAAEYVAHEKGLPISEAHAEAQGAVKQAVASTGGHFVHQSQLTNPGKDCWAACGSQSGYCPSFCGLGACCNKISSATTPECHGASKSDQYQCVAPAAVFPGAVRQRQGDSNSSILVVDAGAQTVEEGSGGLGIGLWMVVLALVLACLVCCGGCWFMSRERKTKGATRTAGVSISKSDGSDLELQEPFSDEPPAAGTRTVAKAAAPLAPMMPTPVPLTSGYQRLAPVSAQGYIAPQAAASTSAPRLPAAPLMPAARSMAPAYSAVGACMPCPSALEEAFDRLDVNRDGVIQRSEWDEAMQAPLVQAHPAASQDWRSAFFHGWETAPGAGGLRPMMAEPVTSQRE